MSAAESEESKCPDLATASIRTQSMRRSVAQRSSSAELGASAPGSTAREGGLGSGTGRRWLTSARVAADAFAGEGSGAAVAMRPRYGDARTEAPRPASANCEHDADAH